jgi:hypothetical protein
MRTLFASWHRTVYIKCFENVRFYKLIRNFGENLVSVSCFKPEYLTESEGSSTLSIVRKSKLENTAFGKLVLFPSCPETVVSFF